MTDNRLWVINKSVAGTVLSAKRFAPLANWQAVALLLKEH